MGLSDLLKMLDNNTASTVKSRYKNKVLECKLIIVTSVLKIDEFFNGVFKEQKEPIVQLKRRCKLHLRFEQDHYYASLFDDKKGDYSEEYKYVNPVATMYPKIELTDEQKEFLNQLADILETETFTNDVEFHDRMYDVLEGIGMKPQKAFQAIYKTIIGKKQGPRAASFVLSLDKDFVLKRFRLEE